MFLNKDSFIINGISMGKYLINIKYGFFDTWSEDTGYALSKKFVGSLEGTYPKFVMTFGRLSQNDINTLTNAIFRTKEQTVTYDDPDGTRKTIKTHKGDFELDFFGINKLKQFSYSLVGNEPIA